MNVEELMTSPVVTVTQETPLKDVARLLVDNRISGVPVCDADGCVVGVVSEEDLLWKELGTSERPDGLLGRLLEAAYGDGQRTAALTAGDAMTTPAVTVPPTMEVSTAARWMIERAVNRLPVVEAGKLVGIVARADLVRAFTRTDEQIGREIRDDVLLHTFWVDPDSVSVSVCAGEVSLSGQIDNQATAELVASCVRRVPGVVAVHSQLHWQVDERPRHGPRSAAQR